MKKLLPKHKPEWKLSNEEFAPGKSTAILEEDTQILSHRSLLQSAKTQQTLNSAWKGTDLMHNHVLADDDQSSLDSLGHRSSLSCLQASDLWEDSMTVYRQPIVTEWVLHLSGYNSRWL